MQVTTSQVTPPMQWMGPLEKDQVWEGDIHVSGDVVIPEGITLSLRPGTKIFFAPKPLWACAVFRSSPEGYPRGGLLPGIV